VPVHTVPASVLFARSLVAPCGKNRQRQKGQKCEEKCSAPIRLLRGSFSTISSAQGTDAQAGAAEVCNRLDYHSRKSKLNSVRHLTQRYCSFGNAKLREKWA
jgi:hypothetical protein